MRSKKELSELLFKILDKHGYSEERIQERIRTRDKCSLAKTMSTQDICINQKLDKFLVGSQMEGISLNGESDFDWMQVNNSVLCTDKPKNITIESDGQIIFHIERKNAPDGYVYLRSINQDSNRHPYFEKLKHALEECENGIFLSSAKYMNMNEDVFYGREGHIARNAIYKEKIGPAIKMIVNESALEGWLLHSIDICHDMDLVRGFQCFCPSVLDNWLHRRRFSSWPSQETEDKIAKLPYHVVPVGLAGSPDEHLQWRLSFTLAEICLVRSFNETQRKMLIILRYIARHILKDIAPEITSYIMKNIAFWMAEETPADQFKPEDLFERVVDAIEYLLVCVNRKKLKNYFIPERNLFLGKLEGKQRECLVKKLEELKDNGQVLLTNFVQCQNIEEDYLGIARLLHNLQFLNLYDKIESLNLATFSPKILAKIYTYCFQWKSPIKLHSYAFSVNILIIGRFGMKMVTDPLSIELTDKIKESQSTTLTRLTLYYYDNMFVFHLYFHLEVYEAQPSAKSSANTG